MKMRQFFSALFHFKRFDKYISGILALLQDQTINELDCSSPAWELSEKNPFLMDRDTAVELGGYPKESINLLVPSSALTSLSPYSDEIYCIGDPELLYGREKQVSFGKIVLLETENVPDDELYAFTQNELLTDSRIRMKDIMLRQSPTHYNINLRVGKKAAASGLTLSSMGKTIQNAFTDMKYVKSAAVIFIIGESSLYKKLLETAEKIKELTLTLNHIFDGIDMDCGHCDLSAVCNEVEGLRALHKKQQNK